MTTRIVLQHLAGSKINQIEQFPLEGTSEITFGRDPSNAVSFDGQRDDAASRKHAVLRISGTPDRPEFRLTDLGSSNGTFVNGTRLTAEQELIPGDIVEFGGGGPKIAFDVQPRPAHLVARTRIMSGPTATAATRVASTTPATAPVPTRVGVGRETVARMLSDERRSTSRVWMAVVGGVLLLAVLGGAAFTIFSKRQIEAVRAENAQKLAAAKEVHDREAAAADEDKRRHPAPISAEEIYRRFHDATVEVSMEWRAIDKDSGRPVYHKVFHYYDKKSGNTILLPCYVLLPNGDIVRWLTTEDQDHENHLVGARGLGTGFVVSSNGFIMTNKHVAAGWRLPYSTYSEGYEHGPGLLFVKIGDPRKFKLIPELADPAIFSTLAKWRPGEDRTIIFAPNVPAPLAGDRHEITGENIDLHVRFPANAQEVGAKLVSSSDEADAAEIKVDTQQNLRTVPMAPDDVVHNGQQVVVLGYPNFSTPLFMVRNTSEAGNMEKRVDTIPEPTVTEGNISVLGMAEKQQGDVTLVGLMGDVYQLTVPSSHGNSGGPVFDDKGHVIGLFTYALANRETTTYAVPIRYARNLMQVQSAQ